MTPGHSWHGEREYEIMRGESMNKEREEEGIYVQAGVQSAWHDMHGVSRGYLVDKISKTWFLVSINECWRATNVKEWWAKTLALFINTWYLLYVFVSSSPSLTYASSGGRRPSFRSRSRGSQTQISASQRQLLGPPHSTACTRLQEHSVQTAATCHSLHIQGLLRTPTTDRPPSLPRRVPARKNTQWNKQEAHQ